MRSLLIVIAASSAAVASAPQSVSAYEYAVEKDLERIAEDGAAEVEAEVDAVVGPEVKEESTVSLWGPRVGVTAVIGEEGRLLQERLGLRAPVMTQLGWQFEFRFFSQASGWTGVNELLLMLGGLEQGTILPTASWIVGVRTPFGFEFGVGPLINFVQMASSIDRGTFGFGPTGRTNPDGTPELRSLEGLGVAIAAGMAIPVGDVKFPINLAVVPNRDGVRLTLLFGFTLPEG